MNNKLDYFFVGWNSELLFNILMENNCNMLLSQYNNRPMIKRVIEYKKEHPESFYHALCLKIRKILIYLKENTNELYY